MSLIIGGILRSKVALFADSAGTKVMYVPSLRLIVAWAGYFNRPPLTIVSSTEPEFLNPNEHAGNLSVDARMQVLIEHINSLEHVHPNGKQALIFVAASYENVHKIKVFESWGGKGEWPPTGENLPPLFMAGCLEPFGITGAYTRLLDSVSSVSSLANLGVDKIKQANDWLCKCGMSPNIQPPLAGYMLSKKGLTKVQRS